MKILLFIPSLFLISACASYPVPKYAVSTKNIMMAKKMGSKKIGLNFTSTAKASGNDNGDKLLGNKIKCRLAGPITIIDGKRFSEYIKQALIDELQLAGVYSDNSPRKVTVNLSRVDLQTTPTEWDLDGQVKMGKKSKKIEIREKFEGSFIADNACRDSAASFSTAVEKFNAEVIRFVKK